jgi:hypothetical protein
MPPMRHCSRVTSSILLLAALVLPACTSKPIDLPKALQVTDVTTGYFDAGIVEGNKNKIVPTISMRLKNVSNEPIESVQMMAKFNVIGDPEELGSAPYVRAIGPEGLAPGQTGDQIVMKTNLGYTSEASRAAMLTSSYFKDVKVELWGKYKAQQFQKVGEFKIARQLLTAVK